MDIRSYNRDAWDKAVERSDRWTIGVGADVIAKARAGEWSVILTPTKCVPREWFPSSMNGVDLLGLAAAGGQQGPVFAASGARVTILDNSPKQLEQDRLIAERDGLQMTLVEGDMCNMQEIADESFDLVFNPCSTCFVQDVRAVWRESHRVLRPGGILMTGSINPLMYCFDKALERQGKLEVKFALPYSDIGSLSDEERARYTNYQAPLEFSHTLSDLIAGQLDAGFALTHFFEDDWGGSEMVDKFFPSFFATRAVKRR